LRSRSRNINNKMRASAATTPPIIAPSGSDRGLELGGLKFEEDEVGEDEVGEDEVGEEDELEEENVGVVLESEVVLTPCRE
jgi:hypothetical protein